MSNLDLITLLAGHHVSTTIENAVKCEVCLDGCKGRLPHIAFARRGIMVPRLR